MTRAGAPTDVVVRDYEPSDLDACLAVFDTNVPRFFREPEREELVAYLSALPGPYLVLEAPDGTVVGCGGLAIVEEEGRADLCWGMVRSERHGTGLGRRLTEARLERAARHPGVEVVALNTSQHTVGFYEALGFETVAVEADGYAAGLDRCEMRKRV